MIASLGLVSCARVKTVEITPKDKHYAEYYSSTPLDKKVKR